LHFSRRVTVCVLAALAVSIPIACQSEDPYTHTLRLRQSFGVELKSWSPGGERTRFEVEIRGPSGVLDQLTVFIIQYDEAEAPLREDRVALPLDGLGNLGVTQMMASVPAPDVEPASMSVQVEVYPPRERLGEFPELQGLQPPPLEPPPNETDPGAGD
jgi:hypothetical protein